MNVAVLGASASPNRYSNKAVSALQEKGFNPLPINPATAIDSINGLRVYNNLKEIEEPIDTITVYLSAKNSDKITDDILNSKARRVIFNPGAENLNLETKLKEKGIQTLNTCTLVMLATDQF